MSGTNEKETGIRFVKSQTKSHPMKIQLSIFLSLSLISASFAQTASTESIRRAALDYLEGFYQGDTVILKRSLAPNVYKYGYWLDKKTGKYGGEQMTFRQAVDYAKNVMAKKRFPKPDAPKGVVILDEEEQVAVAKVTAWWGIDYLLMAKHEDKWMIEQIIWQGPIETIKKL
jgi:hypothetical protein